MKLICKDYYRYSRDLKMLETMQLVFSIYFGVSFRLSFIPNTPLSVLIKLSDDKESWVRREVAIFGNTPYFLLKNLVKIKKDP